MTQTIGPSFFASLKQGEEFEITCWSDFIRLGTGQKRTLHGQRSRSFSKTRFEGIWGLVETLNEALALVGFKLAWRQQYVERDDTPRNPANARPFSPEFGHKSFLPHGLSTSLILRVERLPSP